METTNPTPIEDPSRDITELRDNMSSINRSVDDPLQAAHEARLKELRQKVAEATTEPHQIDPQSTAPNQPADPEATPPTTQQ